MGISRRINFVSWNKSGPEQVLHLSGQGKLNPPPLISTRAATIPDDVPSLLCSFTAISGLGSIFGSVVQSNEVQCPRAMCNSRGFLGSMVRGNVRRVVVLQLVSRFDRTQLTAGTEYSQGVPDSIGKVAKREILSPGACVNHREEMVEEPGWVFRGMNLAESGIGPSI
jgi:hypothetical protein